MKVSDQTLDKTCTVVDFWLGQLVSSERRLRQTQGQSEIYKMWAMLVSKAVSHCHVFTSMLHISQTDRAMCVREDGKRRPASVHCGSWKRWCNQKAWEEDRFLDCPWILGDHPPPDLPEYLGSAPCFPIYWHLCVLLQLSGFLRPGYPTSSSVIMKTPEILLPAGP